MDDAHRGGRRGRNAEDLVLRAVAAHADSLLRTARRVSLCPDDAQDAYQRTLEIFMAHAERLEPDAVAGWLHVVVKREAQAIRRSRQRYVGCDEVDLDKYESHSTPTPDERVASFDLVGRAAEALQRLKPQELRALWLKGQGHSYNEISALTGWSYTKVNRCLTEGRRSFLSRYATIESGDECERWLPVISAMVDGEASQEQLMALRPHLRNCPGCRATLKALRGSSEPLAAVLPVELAANLADDGGDRLTNLVTRIYETIAGGFHERAIHSFTKAQSAVEAASAGKLAAVAASAAAVAGGGYATVERKVPHVRGHDKPTKAAQRDPVRAPATVQRVVVKAPPVVRKVRRSSPAARSVGEFGRTARATTKVQSPEFQSINGSEPQFTRAAASEPVAANASSVPDPGSQPAAPEFAGAGPAPEFGG